MTTATFSNPSTVHAPLGLYSHSVTTPPGAQLVFLAGQIGVAPDGSTPDGIAAQADQVFANIIAILAAQDLGPDSIIKLTTYMVTGSDGSKVREARQRYLGEHCPTSTSIYVPQLADAKWLVEVEAIAMRTAGG